MSKVILSVFSERNDAERALNDLSNSGYNTKDISIVMKDSADAQGMAHSTGASVADGAVSGATTGAAVGALAGLLIGIGAIAVPGIGGLLIGGPLAAALGLSGAAATTVSGAVTGAVAGGLVGALVGLGVPEEDAKEYERRVNEGAVLLAVPSRNDDDQDAKTILQNNHADQIRDVQVNS